MQAPACLFGGGCGQAFGPGCKAVEHVLKSHCDVELEWDGVQVLRCVSLQLTHGLAKHSATDSPQSDLTLFFFFF